MKDIIRRVFSRKQPQNVTKSIRVTKEMETALEILADQAGETLNAYIVLVLDQYLQVQVEQGNLKLPTQVDEEQSAS